MRRGGADSVMRVWAGGGAVALGMVGGSGGGGGGRADSTGLVDWVEEHMQQYG
jgi:hypothetical protein